jgi:hypothetical protein
MTKKLTDEAKKERKENRRIKKEKIFLEKANDKFNDKFNYEEFEYINETTKGIIICHKHGEFKQEPRLHLTLKYGCPKCSCLLNDEESEKRRLKFINDANKKYNNKFNYEKFIFINVDEKGIIICPNHGEFKQSPYIHLKSNYGCKECAGFKKRDIAIFIDEANKIHNSKYDYSLSIFKNMKTKIIILCSEHGKFEQTPNSHIYKKSGCPYCKNNLLSFKNSSNIEEFSKKANFIHNFRYSYTYSDYINNHTKIKILCNRCNKIFEKRPNDHLCGQGCKDCDKISKNNENIKIKKRVFIEKAWEIHANKFDYSKFEYITCDTPGTIICPIHGPFQQTPYTHLHSKICCPKCVGNEKKTLNKFIKEANEIHEYKYNYSKFEYINARTKSIIICHDHGEFEQTPDVHINHKCGCKKCGFLNSADKQRGNKEEFIKEANEIHADKFDYSKFEYITCDTAGTIICPIHGSFKQTPYQHLKTKFGCIKCSGCSKKTLNEFIKEANEIHEYKYNYELIKNLEGMHSKITIICKIHGKFTKSADSHLNGKSGCPKCSKNGTSKIAQEWINLLLIKQQKLIHFYHENGEYTIPNTNYKADGYKKETKTIYEFHGDFWHGNPEVFNHKLMNDVCKKTFGELYEKTMKKQRKCEELGYKYKSIWENDWIKGKLALKRIQNNFRHKQMLKKFPYQCEKCNFKCKYKSEYERHCNSILHKTGKRGVKKNKVNRVCQFCKLYEASCNTNLKNHILINHKTAEEREKEYPNYCKTCDYGSFSKKLFDKHLATKKHKKKEEMVKKLKDVD